MVLDCLDQPQWIITFTAPDGWTPQSITLRMILDTGADLTCIPRSRWPWSWPLGQAMPLMGINGIQMVPRSQSVLKATGTDDDGSPITAHVCPALTASPDGALGRDALTQMKIRLTNLI